MLIMYNVVVSPPMRLHSIPNKNAKRQFVNFDFTGNIKKILSYSYLDMIEIESFDMRKKSSSSIVVHFGTMMAKYISFSLEISPKF